MQAIVIRLSDLTFLSSEDLSGACSQAELGEKIIKQFAFLTGDLRVTITDGTARIEYRQPAADKMSEAQRLSEQAAQKAKSGDFPQALHLFTQAVAANPALPVARRDLAMLHYELGDLSAPKISSSMPCDSLPMMPGAMSCWGIFSPASRIGILPSAFSPRRLI
jgi:hypothetical protein